MKERLKVEPVDPQRVFQFIQTRVLAAKLEQIREGVTRLPKERTYVVNPTSPMTIDGRQEVCSVHGSGKMHEFLVISPATQFSLYIKVDDKPPIYDDTYASLAQISDDSNEVTAYQNEDTNEYVIHIGELKFSKSLVIEIHGIGTASRIFLKYTLSPPQETLNKL